MLGLGIKPRAKIEDLGARWILNADAVPTPGVLYIWKDAEAWTDANVWKD